MGDLPSLADILYVSSKVTETKYEKHKTVADLPTDVQEYLSSSSYKALQRYDFLLHELAIQALECEIEKLGEIFQRDLDRFQRMKIAVAERCPTEEEDRSDCYLQDRGCQRTCVQEVAADFSD